MDTEHYSFILGALSRIDRKLDYIIESHQPKEPLKDVDEFEEEFDI
jgi:hypothetical protein